MTTSNNFDFSKIGKRMPYSTPEGFFDQLEKDVLEKVNNFSAGNTHHKDDTRTEERRALRVVTNMQRLMRRAIAIAAAVALAFIISMNIDYKNTSTMDDVDKAFGQLSTDDQQFMLNVYQADTFMDE